VTHLKDYKVKQLTQHQQEQHNNQQGKANHPRQTTIPTPAIATSKISKKVQYQVFLTSNES
jgi:hypothetical protein